MEGAYSIIPSLIAIIIAIKTKQVLPALIAGLLVGAYLIESSFLGGITKTTDYLVNSVLIKENIEIIFFLYIFSGFIGMIKVSGGIKGIEDLISRYVKTEKGTLITTWGLALVTFIDCGFHIISVGSIMKSVSKKAKVAKDKISYIIDATTVPIIVLIPLGTTYIGYMVSLLENGLSEQKMNIDAYTLFLKSIPFNFYSIVSIGISLFVILTGKYIHWKRGFVVNKSEVHVHNIDGFNNNIKPRAFNLILPLILLFGSTIFFLWWSGNKVSSSFLTALMKAETSKMMLIALLFTTIATTLYYFFQKIKIDDLMRGFIDGGNEIMMAIVLLVLVWGLSSVSNDLGFADFITSSLGGLLPAALVPFILFLLGCLISYFIGTSWGTWGLLMPLGISMAIATDANLALTVGAVFAGGTFGDHISPLSETTVVTATVLKIPVMKHANNQLPYGIIGLIMSAFLYLVVGFF